MIDVLVNASSLYMTFLVDSNANTDQLRIDRGSGSLVNNITGPGMGSVMITFGGGSSSTLAEVIAGAVAATVARRHGKCRPIRRPQFLKEAREIVADQHCGTGDV